LLFYRFTIIDDTFNIIGIAKEFEVIDTLPRVITLQDDFDDDAYLSLDWEEDSEAWERMYESESESEMSQAGLGAEKSVTSYAGALKGKDKEKLGSG
jgi:hypothetical protein